MMIPIFVWFVAIASVVILAIAALFAAVMFLLTR